MKHIHRVLKVTPNSVYFVECFRILANFEKKSIFTDLEKPSWDSIRLKFKQTAFSGSKLWKNNSSLNFLFFMIFKLFSSFRQFFKKHSQFFQRKFFLFLFKKRNFIIKENSFFFMQKFIILVYTSSLLVFLFQKRTKIQRSLFFEARGALKMKKTRFQKSLSISPKSFLLLQSNEKFLDF